MRLRQIALVAHDLAKAREDIAAVLGLDYAYDDPGVGKYGLHNAVFPVGNTFLEVVSPTVNGTTAGRLLAKRCGDGGYMVILQVEDLAAARRRVLQVGVRIADQTDGEGFAFTHLHPKDVGGAIVSLDAMQPWDRWEWGGPRWEGHVRTDTSLGIVGAEVQANEPAAMAARWAEVLDLPTEARDGAWRIALDGGEIRFVPTEDGRGEGLSGFDVEVHDPEAVRATAARRGLIDDKGSVVLSGTRVGLVSCP
jgi:catechol 2,3-dioxygenase-like lactoylglutathione lyase family enzyme